MVRKTFILNKLVRLVSTAPAPSIRCQARPLSAWKLRCGQALLGLTLGFVGNVCGRPALSAERVSISLGILGDSFQVSSLETFAQTGKIEPDLRDYFRLLDDEQEVQFREALNTSADVSVVAVAQFLYSPQGEILLERLGQVIQSEARQPGFFAIRAALILAAAEPGGLTPLNVVRKFPTSGVRISLGRGWEIAQELNDLVRKTKSSVAEVRAQSDAEFAEETQLGIAAIASTLPDLSLAGPLGWDREVLVLKDVRRDRNLPVDLYLPAARDSATAPWPTVVISHGLKSDRTSFVYLAEHLASHGFAVIVPEHPGSNTEQFEALLQGRANEISAPQAFLDRPLDITFVLDFLEENEQFSPLLKLDQVGMVGQSFGGYTALVLGGAQLNPEQLEESCEDLDQSWNISLALQCRALTLPLPGDGLQDERITNAVVINPFTSAVFGRKGLAGLAVPTLVVSGELDTIAPAVLEQIRPFRWIQGEGRNLALMLGGTHFSTIAENPEEEDFPLPEPIVGRDLATAQNYVKALSLASFETYLTGRLAGQPYLSNAYVKSFDQGRLGLDLIRQLP